MKNIAQALIQLRESIHAAEQRFGRRPGSVSLLAVSKTRPAADLLAAAQAGQRAFGENYVQEALGKIDACADRGLSWHLIGPLQSNKARDVATRFDWVHTVDRPKIAVRLNELRPLHMAPLNVCIQVNIDDETSKSGIAPDALPALAATVAELPHLRLRGLMAMPALRSGTDAQRAPFARLRGLHEQLLRDHPDLDTLSMGTTADMAAAIAEGATIVRIGTALFGARAR